MLAHIGDMRVNYERTGSGKGTIVLVHSLGADLSIFQPQADALSADYDIVRYDIRGHGGSPLGVGEPSLALLADDLASLLDHLDISAAHLVGQSIGGMIILALATRRKLQRHTLCLFDTIGWTNPQWDRKYAARAAEVDSKGMAAVAHSVATDALGKTTHATRPSIRDAYTERIGNAGAAGYSWCCKAMIGFDFRPALSGVTCPVQLLAGEEDVITPLPHLHDLASALPDAAVHPVPGAGHVPFVEIPSEATNCVRAWTDRNPLVGVGAV